MRRLSGEPEGTALVYNDRVADMFRALLGACIIALVLLGIFAWHHGCKIPPFTGA